MRRAALALWSLLFVCGATFAAEPSASVRVRLLAINDFHGQLTSTQSVGGRPVGGAAVLASYLQDAGLADGSDLDASRTILVHAGDLVGASPAASALLGDEPTYMVLARLANAHCTRAARMDPQCNVVGTLGNHEFDHGRAELVRQLDGGNARGGPYLVDPWTGVPFPYVSANVLDAATGQPVLPPYVIKRVDGVPIAFIGATLRGAPAVILPSNIAGLRFADEAESINAYVPELRRQGVHAIVVLLHQGGMQPAYQGPTRPERSGGLRGDVLDVVRRLDEDVDVVVSGHSHLFTNALVPNRGGRPVLVTQAFKNGSAFASIDLDIDRASGDVAGKTASIVTTFADAGPGRTPDAKAAAIVAAAEARVATLVGRVVGTSAAPVSTRQTGSGESAMGDLVADAQRAAMHADIAFMNPGGIRTALPAGQITWGDLQRAQPFGNTLYRIELTGQQVVDALERQWAVSEGPKMLQLSGLRYTWSGRRPAGSRVVDVTVGDRPLDRAATYSVCLNDFLLGGGDEFALFTRVPGRVAGPTDLDALVAYIASLPQPFTAKTDGRITRVD